MGRCVTAKAPPSPLPNLLQRNISTCRASRPKGSAFPDRTRTSRLKRQASEQSAAGQPYSELREVEQVLEGWQKEEQTPQSSEQQALRGTVIDTSIVHPSRTELQRQREVAEALKLVDAAMKAAEGQLGDIPNLPSARLKRKVAVNTFSHLLLALPSNAHAWAGNSLQDAHAHAFH